MKFIVRLKVGGLAVRFVKNLNGKFPNAVSDKQATRFDSSSEAQQRAAEFGLKQFYVESL